METPVSFSVANINPGTVRTEFMLSMMQLVEKERALGLEIDPATPRVRFDQFFALFSGPYLDDSRNRCVNWFFTTDSDYLVFIDSDIGFNANQVFDLIETAHNNGVTILTGVYYNQFGNKLRALVHEWGDPAESQGIDPALLDDDARDLIPLAPIHLTSFYPQNKPHPVDACGAGFVAIHRKVFIDMSARYALPQQFFAELCLGGIHMGEDLTFCVRAKAVGHQTYVLPSIEVDHYKTCRVRSQPGSVI